MFLLKLVFLEAIPISEQEAVTGISEVLDMEISILKRSSGHLTV